MVSVFLMPLDIGALSTCAIGDEKQVRSKSTGAHHLEFPPRAHFGAQAGITNRHSSAVSPA